MCQCRTTADGRVIVCDPCAAGMIDAISDLLPGDQYAQQLPESFTASEYQGMQSAVNGWLDGLQGQSQEEARKW